MHLLVATLLCAASAQTRSQTPPSNPPAAPAPPPKSIFTLPSSPLGTHVAAPSTAPTTPDVTLTCSAPAEGIYGPHPRLPPQLEEARHRFLFQPFNRLDTMWTRHMPRSANDPWVRRAAVTVRFAILPNGDIDDPLVTVSSGRHDFDKHALDAIREASPYDPLPTGITRAVPVCVKFGYNTQPENQDPAPWETKPPAAKPPASQ